MAWKVLEYREYRKKVGNSEYRISVDSVRGNYSFLNLTDETIRGNSVINIFHGKAQMCDDAVNNLKQGKLRFKIFCTGRQGGAVAVLGVGHIYSHLLTN